MHLGLPRNRRRRYLTLILLLFLVLILLAGLHSVLRVDSSPNLAFLKRSRSLRSYINEDNVINTLVEPTTPHCSVSGDTPVLVLVNSEPANALQRLTIRETWGTKLKPYFCFGTKSDNTKQLRASYAEALKYNDVVVFDLEESYLNLTLKTALMMRWALRKCPRAPAVMKVDDDVLINPWTLRGVLADHADDTVVGHKYKDVRTYRNKKSKWYVPRWLFPQDTIPEFIAGTSYIINGKYLKNIYDAAFLTPLIHLEDVYFTYLVSKGTLGYKLSHDSRISPYQPMFSFPCTYWGVASIHSIKPAAMHSIWKTIHALGEKFDSGGSVCTIYNKYFRFFSHEFLFYL